MEWQKEMGTTSVPLSTPEPPPAAAAVETTSTDVTGSEITEGTAFQRADTIAMERQKVRAERKPSPFFACSNVVSVVPVALEHSADLADGPIREPGSTYDVGKIHHPERP